MFVCFLRPDPVILVFKEINIFIKCVSSFQTPILCKTRFITTTDYSTSENALSFTKGTEMAVKGVRIDGWWFCFNKEKQESGWVYMDYLRPKSDEKW